MLKPGDRINIVYYDEDSQTKSNDWVVEEYDSGLLKVVREPTPGRRIVFGGSESANEDFKIDVPGMPEQTQIFNLRSIGFLRVELVGRDQQTRA